MFSQECGPLESLLNYYHNTNTVRAQSEGNSKGAVFVASLCVRSQGDQEKEKKGTWTARCHSASDMYLELLLCMPVSECPLKSCIRTLTLAEQKKVHRKPALHDGASDIPVCGLL